MNRAFNVFSYLETEHGNLVVVLSNRRCLDSLKTLKDAMGSSVSYLTLEDPTGFFAWEWSKPKSVWVDVFE